MCLLTFTSCDNESEVLELNEESAVQTISTRSNSNDLAWVVDFQENLQKLYYDQPATQSYSANEIAYGLEWMFNFRYAEGTDSEDHINQSGVKLLLNEITNENLLNVYTQIENHIVNEINDNPQMKFDYVEIKVETEQEELSIEVQSHYTISHPGLFEGFDIDNTSCENNPFTNDEYFLGLGGEDGEEPWLPCTPQPYECGTDASGVPNLFALEQVQNFSNFKIRNPFICKNGGVPFYTNHKSVYLPQVLSILDIMVECDNTLNANDANLKGCSCVSADFMNCLFCKTEEIMSSSIIIEQIPSNNNIISIDLSVVEFSANSPTYYKIVIKTAEFHCGPGIPHNNPTIFTPLCC